jgi:Transposase DDE domain group 1
VTFKQLAAARAKARAEAWAAGADPGVYVVDIDATLVEPHSEKQDAEANYKHGFGFAPVLAYLDATGEALAGLLRPGNAPPGKAEDLVGVLDEALEQLPVDPRSKQVVIRSGSAGHSHEFVAGCRGRHARFIVGAPLVEEFQLALWDLPGQRWAPAISADGMDERDHVQVAEITDLVDLSGWPDGTRAITRREEAHPGAQLSFTDIDGHRYLVFISDLDDPDIAYLDALYRGRGRAEKRICETKDTGLSNFPSYSFAINKAWLTVVLIAHDLLAWLKLLCLDGEMAHAEPKRLRYCLLHTAGAITRSARRARLRLSAPWPWSKQLTNVFANLRAQGERS